MRTQMTWGVTMGQADPSPCLRSARKPVALNPYSGCSLRGALTSGMYVGENGEGRGPQWVCVCMGAGRGGGPKEQRLGTRSPAPPHQAPGSWGPGALFWGTGIHAEERPPSSGLDPVRKEINKKGGKGSWGWKGSGYSVQTKGPGDGGRVSPGQARAGVRVSLGLGPRCRGLRGLR